MRCLDYRIRRSKVWKLVSNLRKIYASHQWVHTDVRTKIRRRLHLDIQIAIHFANNLYCVAHSEMWVLVSGLASEYFISARLTYSCQDYIDVSACVDDGGFAPKLHDFAEDADDAVLELGEVRGEDAGGLGMVHCKDFRCVVCLSKVLLGWLID
jgi:hypothetical protein